MPKHIGVLTGRGDASALNAFRLLASCQSGERQR
jgi:hypothetical protein